MAATAKNDMMSQLAKQTPITKIGLLALAIAVCGVFYWQFFYKDLKSEKESLENTRNGLLSTQASLTRRIDELDKLKQKRDALQAELAGIEFALPADAELNSFLDHLQTKAGDAGVSLKSWKQVPEVTVGKYNKVPLQVTVEGNFYQLMNYFYMLGPDQAEGDPGDAGTDDGPRFDRIVTIENLSMSAASLRNDEILLTATFNASTFRQPGAKPTAPTPAPSAPKGAANAPKRFNTSGQSGNAANSMIKDTDAARKKREESVKEGLGEAGAGQ